MATELWRTAAAAGYPLAQFNLALAYEQGFGVARDYLEAARWYSEAGDHGVADAAFALSELYRTGRGVPQHDQLAKLWHDVAVKLGSKLALRQRFAAAIPTVPPPTANAAPPPKPRPRHAADTATAPKPTTPQAAAAPATQPPPPPPSAAPPAAQPEPA